MFAYVYGPVCVLIFVDIIFFVMTSILLRRAGIGSRNRHSREKYRLVCHLFFSSPSHQYITVINVFNFGPESFEYLIQQLARHFRLVRPENPFVAGRVRGVRHRLSQRSGVRHRRHRNLV